MKKLIYILPFFLLAVKTYSQSYSIHDTLRGSVTPERAWWDLNHYFLDIEVDPVEKTIRGTNTISYTVLKPYNLLQLDLQAPLRIKAVIQNGDSLTYDAIGPAHFIKLRQIPDVGTSQRLVVHYEGTPHVAKRAPWDGGITWSTDSQGKPFAASSCQGIGASIWWPCKDHMSDEPDSMKIRVTVPDGLMNVSNGQLIDAETKGGKSTFTWNVKNPINNYGVNINIADYVHFGETYAGLSGPLKVDYYVLRENEEKAKNQFLQVPLMLDAFEYWFGPYPFYEDGFKIVEVPYLGMEHQSSVTYGNGFQNGYRGRDLSDTGWGMKFDFIIIHESGHEWFANNITYKDPADMWIHEGFTAYSESLFLEYHFGKNAGAEYVIGTRSNIANDRPIIAPYNVNAVGSGDMYYKGSNMLHTLRSWLDNDSLWHDALRGLNRTFYHQTVTSTQIETYLSEKLGLPLTPFFDQYLRDHRIPIFEYRIKSDGFWYRWSNVVDNFNMGIHVILNNKKLKLSPSSQWQVYRFPQPAEELSIDKNFYVAGLNIFGQ